MKSDLAKRETAKSEITLRKMRGPSEHFPMRINGPNPALTQLQGVQSEGLKQLHQVRVLKKALESQQTAADQLLKMLEPKGKNLDIKA